MADLTGTLKVSNRVPNEFESPIKWKVIDLDYSTNTDWAAAGTHNILTLNAGDCIVRGFGVVHTNFTSTSSDTLQFSAQEAISAAFTADDLDAGDIVFFGQHDFEDTVGVKTYNASADTLDIIVDDHAITAGRMLVFVGIAKVVQQSMSGEDRRRRSLFTLVAALIFVVSFSLVSVSLRFPFWGGQKTSYALGALVPIAICSGIGTASIDRWLAKRRLRMLRVLFYGWFGVFVAVLAASFGI